VDYTKLRSKLVTAQSQAEFYDAIVNAPFEFKMETAFLFLGIIVLLIVDEDTGNIDRVALSKTELADNTTTVSVKPFHDIKIPVSYADNTISTAIQTQAMQETTDWKNLFAPAMSAEEARLNQASGGISYSAVYPLSYNKKRAAIIYSYYQYLHEIGDQQHAFMDDYTKLVAEVASRKRFKK
jgi:hypothetical protein